MVHEGFLRYGGVEVINTERLAAYIANGTAPGGYTFDVPAIAEGLAAVLTGDGPYRTPQQDAPPWLDPDDPDTADFAGLLPIEVTGTDDTTRTVEMTPLLGDGALPQLARRGPRTVGVTAMLVGRTTEGVHAGLSWLQRTLHLDCDDDRAPCEPTAPLEYLTTAPTISDGSADTTVPPVTTTQLAPTLVGGSSDWVPTNGDFTTAVVDGTTFRPYSTAPVYEGSAEADLILDGGGATPVTDLIVGTDLIDTTSGTIAGARQTCTDGPVTVVWTMRNDTFEVSRATVELVLLGDDGQPFAYGPKVNPEDTMDTYTWVLPFGVDEDWRPALVTDDDIVVASVAVSRQPTLSPMACVAPYQRLLPDAVCTSGPTIVSILSSDCVELLTVEWVWQIGSPYRYGPTTALLAGLTAETDPTFTAVAVETDRVYTSTTAQAIAAAYCPTPPLAPSNCATDPGSPALAVAPTLPAIVSPNQITIAAASTVRRYTVLVQPDRVPGSDGVFSIDLRAMGAPVVGARVRVYDDPSPTGDVLSVCDFAYEYLIDYVPANGTLTIGGPLEQVATLCDGETRYADARGVVRGSYGGPLEQPHARCNNRYLIVVDQLDKYPRTVPGVYTNGTEQPPLRLGLAVTPREG